MISTTRHLLSLDIGRVSMMRTRSPTPQVFSSSCAFILTVFLIGIITVSLVVATFAVYVFGFIDDTLPEDLDNLVLNFTTTIYVKDSKTDEYVEYKRIHGGENRIWVDF